MVKIWVHKSGGTEPYLLTETSVQNCRTQFDLSDATYLQPLGEHPPTNEQPGPLGDNSDPELVVFEVLADEAKTEFKPGYYASQMSYDTVQELIGEE